MTVQVNPPPQVRIPDSLARDPEAFGYFRQINQILFQLWTRTGGETDAVSATEVVDLYSSSQPVTEDALEVLYPMVNAGLVPQTSVIAASAAFTTTGTQVVICTNTAAMTIKLNATPDDGEEVEIKRQNAAVTIDGNGQTVDGATSVVILAQYDSPHLVYTVAANEWSII